MTKNKLSTSQQNDTVCYCERCGISFLWTSEEKKRPNSLVATSGGDGLPPPTHCPGCRQLLPLGARQRGLVKWYNARKRFGFIIRAVGNELFAHGSELKGIKTLRPGDLVEFGTKATDRGEAAHEVVLLQQSDDPK